MTAQQGGRPLPNNKAARSTGMGAGALTPTSLGAFMLLAMVYGDAQATPTAAKQQSIREFLQALQQQPGEFQGLLELLRETHPEIADRLLRTDVSGEKIEFDLKELAKAIDELEASGYLKEEDAARLRQMLQALEEEESGSTRSTMLAQAAGDTATDAGAAGAVEGAAEGVAIESLPATGIGPAAFGLGPMVVAGGAALVVTPDDAATGLMVVEGTHLKTSVKQLQDLGIDKVNFITPAAMVGLDLGDGPINWSDLPNISTAGGAAVKLGIVADDADQLDATNAAALRQAGVDYLDVQGDAISISEAQAAALISAGLEFVADDVGVALGATGTHLSTSLGELQQLGVDMVHTDPGAHTVHLGMGALDPNSDLPVFDAEDEVRLIVQDTELDAAASYFDNYTGADPGIDELGVVLNASLGVELAGEGVLDARLAEADKVLIVANDSLSEVTLGMILEATDGSADPLATLTGANLTAALQAAGIVDIHINDDSNLTVTDSDLQTLMDAGLISADGGADITITNTDGTLDATLAQLAAIGADHVQVEGGSVKLAAGVDFTDQVGLENALSDLLSTYEAQAGAGAVSGVFTGADTVNLTVAGSLGDTLPTGYQLDPALVTKLELLGIDDIVDDQGNSIK